METAGGGGCSKRTNCIHRYLNMATKTTRSIAHLNLSEIATAHGVSQSKVKEIAYALLDKDFDATPELIAQVFAISSANHCDPLGAIDQLAKESPSDSQPADPLTETINALSDQVYQSLAPIADQVRDNVTARLAVEVLGGFIKKKQGQNTKSVFAHFAQMVKGVNLQPPSLQRQINAGGDGDFLSLPASESVTEVV